MAPCDIRNEIKRLLDEFTPEQHEMIFRLIYLALDYPIYEVPQLF